MKVSGKVYSLVGILGAAAVVIGAMGVFVTVQYGAKTAELMQISQRAFLGEHLNRQVTAVVMEARGIYAAPSAEKAKPFAQGILKNLDDMDASLAQWKPLVPEAQRAAFDAMMAKSADFRTFRSKRRASESRPARRRPMPRAIPRRTGPTARPSRPISMPWSRRIVSNSTR